MAGTKAKSVKKAKTATREPPVAEDERQRMIAERAYYRALERGFEGGDAAEDWLAAEREVAGLLPGPEQKKAERAAYEKLRSDVQALLADVREVGVGTVRETLETARRRLTEAGEHTADTVDKVAATIEKEVAEAVRKLGTKRQTLSARAIDLFEAWRDRGQTFLAEAVAATGEWLKQAGTHLERPVYRTGEMVAGGRFECTGCAQRIELGKPGHLPMCAKCRGVEYRRA